MNNVVPFLGAGARVPPANLAVEQALLGAIMSNAKSMRKVEGFLRPEHFANPVHQKIFEVARRRIEAGGTADALALQADFLPGGIIDLAGGPGYLVELLSATVHSISVAEYGHAIRDAWVRRELIDLGETVVNMAFDGSFSTEDAMSGADRVLARLISEGSGGDTAISWDEAMEQALLSMDAMKRGERRGGISTGMAAVDDVILGLEDGALIVLGGRPGSGKSALGWQWALSAARAGEPVEVISNEMSAMQCGRRGLSVASGVPLRAIRRGEADMEQVAALNKAQAEMRGLPLSIEDGGGLSPALIAAKCHAARRRFGKLRLIMIDHLQIVVADPADAKHGPTAAMTAISGAMKQLAKKFGCPVLLLSQLSRALESRDDKRPTLADLRQTGAIEQDADIVAFIHRPELYVKKTPPEKGPKQSEEAYAAEVAQHYAHKHAVAGKADLIFEKVRDDETAVVPMRWYGKTTHFEPASAADQLLSDEGVMP